MKNGLNKVYHWHRVSSNVRAKTVLLYFRGMPLRDVQKYLSDEGYKVSTEAIREFPLGRKNTKSFIHLCPMGVCR